jgi:hypothetical protein
MGVFMRKLVIILIAFIAVVTFIRALDHSGDLDMNISPGISGTLTP